MSIGKLLIAIGVGGAAAYLVVRKGGLLGAGTDDAAPGKGSEDGLDAALSACNGAEDTNIYTKIACVGGKAVNGWLDGFDTEAADDATNIKLNGAVDIPLEKRLKDVSVGQTFRGPMPALTGSVLRFKNGCEPYKTAPGWGKCAAGTVGMGRDVSPTNPGSAGLGNWTDDEGKAHGPGRQPLNFRNMMQGGQGDPTTYSILNLKTKVQENWVQGKKVECPAGQHISPESTRIVRDHVKGTTTVQYRCIAPGSVVDWGDGPANAGHTLPPLNGDPLMIDERTNVGAGDKPGYHWVAATASVPGHWERDRA